MRIRFEKPVGSHADVKELEYISALHQTSAEIRRDASIQARDIVYMLLSRFALQVEDREVVKQEILTDLAGDPSSEPKHVMDLRQTVSLLLLPHLRKCQAEGDPNDHIAAIAEEIKADFSGLESEYHRDGGGDVGEGSKLYITCDFVRDLLASHGEIEVSEDLIEQMVEVAGGEGVEFDGQSLLKALTQDLEGYNLEWENRWSTSYSDILGATPPIPMGRNGSLLRRASIMSGGQSFKTQQSASGPINQDPEQPPPKEEGKSYTFPSSDDMEEPELKKTMESKAVVRVASLSAIDNTADTFGSQAFAVLMWVAFIVIYIAYVYSNETGDINTDCEASSVPFFCQIGKAIGQWMAIFGKLIVLGGTFFLFSSMGNTVYLPYGTLSILRILVAMAVVITFTIVPAMTSVSTWFFNTDWSTQSSYFEMFNPTGAVLGYLLLGLQLLAIIRLLVPYDTLQSNQGLRRWLSQGAVKKEFHTKRAAAFKTNRMVENALKLRGSEEGDPNTSTLNNGKGGARTSSRSTDSNGEVMSNFLSTSHDKEKSPGMIWAWKAFWTGSICYEEGVWFHSRLLASALAQILVIAVSISILFISIQDAMYAYARARGQDTVCFAGGCTTWYDISNTTNSIAPLRQSVTESFMANAGNNNVTEQQKDQFYKDLENIIYEESGLNITTASDEVQDFFEDPYGAGLDWLIGHAKEEEVIFAIAIGTTFSILSTIWILFGYIPSFIFNVMKFRYGVFPSLYDSDFQILRHAPDHSTLAFGMAFWSTFFMAFFSFAVPGVIAFLLVWDETATYVQGFLAQLIGILSTIIIKVVILALLRNPLIAGLYRKRMAPANLLFMFLECWNIAISAGFLVGRTIIFLILSVFYIGRIDTSFLANGVDKFDFAPNLSLDRAPIVYRKDLILHEAHRHPYLDRLAALYLLKLNLGDSFATRAGSVWRLLYVLTLMPWLRSYRVNACKEDENAEVEGGRPDTPTKETRRESILGAEVARLRAETARLKAEMGTMAMEKKSHHQRDTTKERRGSPGGPVEVYSDEITDDSYSGRGKAKQPERVPTTSSSHSKKKSKKQRSVETGKVKLPEDIPTNSAHSANSKGRKKPKKQRPQQDAGLWEGDQKKVKGKGGRRKEPDSPFEI